MRAFFFHLGLRASPRNIQGQTFKTQTHIFSLRWQGGPSSFIRTTNLSSTSSTSSGSTSLRSGLGSARLWRVAWRYGHWEAPSQALAKCSYDTLHRRALQGTRRSPQASTLSLGMHNGVSSLMHDQDTGIHVLLLDSLTRFARLIYLSLV